MLDRNAIVDKHYRKNYRKLLKFFRGNEDRIQSGYVLAIEQYSNWKAKPESDAMAYINAIFKYDRSTYNG